MEKKTSHPAWALSFKRKGTELRLLNGKYYLYEVTSKWSPEKKRSVKITGKLLGSITEASGFVESEKERLRRQQIRYERIQVKEYGITAVIIFQSRKSSILTYWILYLEENEFISTYSEKDGMIKMNAKKI